MKSKIIVGGLLVVLYGVLWSCQSEGYIQKAQYITNGQKLYLTHCQNCHGAKGEGLGALYPALTDPVRLQERHASLASLVRFGSNEARSETVVFAQKMPSNEQLTPIEIAYVLTYIQNSFGNELGVFSLADVQDQLDAKP